MNMFEVSVQTKVGIECVYGIYANESDEAISRAVRLLGGGRYVSHIEYRVDREKLEWVRV